MKMTRMLMMAAIALAWATNVTAAGDAPQNVASARGCPCGLDPNKTGKIVKFMMSEK